MNSLEEYAKVCSLIASCNDIINGKFILAHNKIAALLKSISASQEVYNLLANYLNNFDFEREFSRAQFKSAHQNHRFVLPEQPEKLLPFVFCVLVNINNRAIDLDSFIREFFTSENANHAEEFQSFAKSVITPFRDLIAKAFDVPSESVATMKVQPLKHEDNTDIEEKAAALEKAAELDEEALKDEEEFDEDEQEDEEKNYPEMTADHVESFLNEIKANCQQILSELPYERKLKDDVKDDVEYITDTIIADCDSLDLKNTIALITALDYAVQKTKTLKIYTREMKNVLVNFYDSDEDDEDDYEEDDD